MRTVVTMVLQQTARQRCGSHSLVSGGPSPVTRLPQTETGRPAASAQTFLRKPPWQGRAMAKAGRPEPERGAVGKTNGKAQPAPPLTVALDTPSARVLADQASVIQDLQFVMDCCKRLLAELGRPERERDAVVPQALWAAALVAYGRCFGGSRPSGLTVDDVQNLPLQGAVTKFHEWVIEERERLPRFRPTRSRPRRSGPRFPGPTR